MYNSKYSDILTKEYLYKEHITDKKSVLQIEQELDCAKGTVRYRLKKYSINIRSILEATKYKRKSFGENKGKYNPNYGKYKKHPVTPLYNSIRNLYESRSWVLKVFERDNYTCQECFKRGCKLEAHHINLFSNILSEFLKEYNKFSPLEDKENLLRLSITYKPFWNLENGKTLCKDCHKLQHKKD